MKENTGSVISIIIVLVLVILGAIALFFWYQPVPPTPVGGGTTATTTEQTYSNATLHYSLSYPVDFTANPAYQYTALGPDTTINGVAFMIPTALAQGTNLSADSYISVESIATSTCSALAFLGDATSTTTQSLTENGITYDVAQGGDAGAGNFYEEHVYAVKGSKPCLAVRYFIHSTNIDNYPAGTVQAFNKTNLLAAFDGIRRSLKLGQ